MKMLLFTPVELPTHLGKCPIQPILIQQVDSLSILYKSNMSMGFNCLFEMFNVCCHQSGYYIHAILTPEGRQKMKMAELPPTSVSLSALVGTL